MRPDRGKTLIEVVTADITLLAVDAIVNAANETRRSLKALAAGTAVRQSLAAAQGLHRIVPDCFSETGTLVYADALAAEAT